MKNKFTLLGIVLALTAGFLIGCDTGTSPSGGDPPPPPPPLPGNNPDFKNPVIADYNISNLTQFEGSVEAVKIEPKQDKSPGARTIFYEGTGGTTRARGTTLPRTYGTYAVTFDVAAASDWNAAIGLPAGTLTINTEVPDTTIPKPDDYDINGINPPSTYNGTAITVSVTAKPGKSGGGVTVLYNNSTTAPMNAGTYAVTFNVAAAEGWYAASGLVAGTLTISKATPNVAFPDNLTATFGQTLADISLPGNDTGTPGSFSWTEVGTTLVGDVGTQSHNLTFTPTDTENYKPISQNVNVAVGKASGAAVDAPTAATVTPTSVTLKDVAAPTNGQTVEYASDTTNAAPSSGWQSDTTFNGLTGGTTYYFFARSAGNDNFEAGTASSGTKITTDTQTPVAGDYTIDGTGTFTYNGNTRTVTATPQEGKSTGARTVLYNGSATEPVNAGTYTVTFNVAAATGWNAANGLSAGTLTINKATGATFSALTGSGFPTQTSVILNVVAAPTNGQTVEYARSTTNAVPSNGWQDTTTFSGLSPATTYYFFVRSKENTNYNAGTANSVEIKTVGYDYIITGSGSSFTAVIRGGATLETDQPVQTAIDAIRTNANGNACSIQFGDGTNVLNIGTDKSTEFNNTGGTWGLITLTGRITSATVNRNSATDNQGTVVITDSVSVDSTADIANTGLDGTSTTAARAVYNNSTGVLNILGGRVEKTNSDGNPVVINANTGTVNIKGGTVFAYDSPAVRNDSTGLITVSGDAFVTSRIMVSGFQSDGTIALMNIGTSTATRLRITGGTVENTRTSDSCAVRNASPGAVEISGGTVTSALYAVQTTHANGSITLGGSPDITGRIRLQAGRLILATTGDTPFNPGTRMHTLHYTSYTTGAVAVTNGANYRGNFTLHNTTLQLVASGNDLVVVGVSIKPPSWRDGGDISLAAPQVAGFPAGEITAQGWQISDDNSSWSNFTPPTTATADLSYNGKYLRYCVTSSGGQTYSNTVPILVVGQTERGVIIEMWDRAGDSWNGEALQIRVNGTNRASNAGLASGCGPDYYVFAVNTGDLVQMYWQTTFDGGRGSYGSLECAFAVYYSDDPPSPTFSPTTDAAVDSGRLLIYQQYRSSGSPWWNGTARGSFTVQ